MTDSKEWCDGDWRCRSSSKPFAGAESGSPGRALEAGKRGSPGRPVQAGIRGKRLICVESFLHHLSYLCKVLATELHVVSGKNRCSKSNRQFLCILI